MILTTQTHTHALIAFSVNFSISVQSLKICIYKYFNLKMEASE